jgi:hypothetical protein
MGLGASGQQQSLSGNLMSRGIKSRQTAEGSCFAILKAILLSQRKQNHLQALAGAAAAEEQNP